MLLTQRRFLLVLLIVVVLGAVLGWTWRDWAPLAGWGKGGAVSSPNVSPRIEADAAMKRPSSMPITPGTWQWQRKDETSAAQFAEALVTVSCDLPDRTVSIGRRGEVANAADVTILTSTQARTFRGRKAGGQIVVTLAADDALLDSLALSRGRFGVEVAGLDAVYPGSWAEVSRVIEDCRAPPAPAR